MTLTGRFGRTLFGRTLGALASAAVFVLASESLVRSQTLPMPLVPHRAVYDLSLGQTRGNSQMAAVRGRIVYDFSGNACEGYALEFRQYSELDSGEGKVATSDLRSTTWEAGDYKSFKFTSENSLNGTVVDSVEGKAEHQPDATVVTLTRPAAKTLRFEPGLVFPTEHMAKAIAAAIAGERILNFPVFDGSESGEKIYNTMTVIGSKIDEQHKPNDATADQAALAGVPRWPVTISYFDRDKSGSSGEQTPAYSMGFELYENGISRALTLDYNDFVVAGTMTSLELKEPKPCP